MGWRRITVCMYRPKKCLQFLTKSDEKTRMALMGLQGEALIAEICNQLGSIESLYYKWGKGFLEAAKS